MSFNFHFTYFGTPVHLPCKILPKFALYYLKKGKHLKPCGNLCPSLSKINLKRKLFIYLIRVYNKFHKTSFRGLFIEGQDFHSFIEYLEHISM